MIAANSPASRSISRKLKSQQVRRYGPDDDVHPICPSCGQLYRNAGIERDGEAPVIDTVDVGVCTVSDRTTHRRPLFFTLWGRPGPVVDYRLPDSAVYDHPSRRPNAPHH